MSKVTIIIPNFNGKLLLAECLPTVYSQTFLDFETVVVDNGSNDGSVLFLRKNFPQVKIIANSKNLGFAAAANSAIKEAKSEFIVLLNNDVAVDRNWLLNLVRAAKKHLECVSFASKILSYNRKKIENAGDKINIVGQAYPVGLGESKEKYTKSNYIFGATGAASLFRREVFYQIGFFDEDFFFYFEDVDWALRSQLAGFKSYLVPKAIAYHKVAQTAKRFGSVIDYLRFRNTIFLVIKNFPAPLFFKRGRWFKIPLVWLHTFYFFVKSGLIIEAFRVFVDLIVFLPKLFIKRWQIMKLKKVDISYFDNLMEEKKLKIFNGLVL